MSQSTKTYGIDSSVFVRLLTGHPESDFQKTANALKGLLDREPTAELKVSNQVIGESYITLQHFYGLSKSDSRKAILQLLTSGAVSPLNGKPVLDLLLSSAGLGLVDRLIAQDYESSGLRVLTNDKRMSKLPGCELLR